jgi:hypothetical protein
MRCAPSKSAAAAIGMLVLCAACGGTPPARSPAGSAAPAAAPAALEGTATHGDHNPHHGGVVLMKGNDLHYEVVLDATGRAHHVYFTDALREELPASVATDVVLTIRHPAEERIAMQIDETGESWVGSGRPVDDPAAATARLAFAVDREPYWIDIPFSPAAAADKRPPQR